MGQGLFGLKVFVGTEIAEEMFFGKLVDPVFFGHLLHAVPLAGAVLHRLQFR